jgi:hypothetical protein
MDQELKQQDYAVGGEGPGSPITGATEEYDGTSWTSNPTLNTAIKNLAGAGIQTAALAFGGQYSLQLQEQLKNMMDQVGHQEQV